MTEVYLLQDNQFTIDTPWEELTPLFTSQVTLDWDYDTLIKYNGQYYHWCGATADNSKIAVRPHNFQVDYENEYCSEDEIVCPFCGYENPDSWEYAQPTTQEYTCPRCGAVMGLEVEHTVNYTTTLKTPGKVLEV